MKKKYPLACALAALALAGAAPLKADVIFYGLQNISIPLDFNGVYVNLTTGVVGSPTFGGSPNWDINPFFGGDGVANSPNFQPARIGTLNSDRIIALGFGATIDGARNYSTGYGGSASSHIGGGADQFQANTPAYIGYRYGSYYGWMRAILNQNTAGGMLFEWAYETGGGAITAGNILQAAPVSNVSVVTITGTVSETYTLGTNLNDVGGGDITAVVKNGAGTWTLGNQNYTGTTTVNAGTLGVGAAGGKLIGTTAVIVNNGGTLLLTNNSTTDRINDAASVTLNAGSTLNTGGLSEGTAPPPIAPLALERPNAALRRLYRNYPVSPRLRWSSGRSFYEPGVAWAMDGDFSQGQDSGNLRRMPFAAPTGTLSGLGALTLQGTSMFPVILDFGLNNVGSTLQFSSLNNLSAGTYVNILNWDGMAGIDNGAASNSRWLFAIDPGFSSAQLANFNFAGYLPGATIISYGGVYEIVPTAIPEPGTWAAGLLAVLAVGYTQRKRFAKH